MKTIDHALGKLAKALEAVMVIALIVMVLVMFMQVVLRYVFATGFAWTEELSRFMMIYMIFIGAAVLASHDGHISVTILDDLFKGVPKKILKLIQYVLTLVYCGVMGQLGLSTLAIVSRQKTPNLQITMDIVYAVIPASMILMGLYILAKIALLFTAQKAAAEEGETR